MFKRPPRSPFQGDGGFLRSNPVAARTAGHHILALVSESLGFRHRSRTWRLRDHLCRECYARHLWSLWGVLRLDFLFKSLLQPHPERLKVEAVHRLVEMLRQVDSYE